MSIVALVFGVLAVLVLLALVTVWVLGALSTTAPAGARGSSNNQSRWRPARGAWNARVPGQYRTVAIALAHAQRKGKSGRLVIHLDPGEHILSDAPGLGPTATAAPDTTWLDVRGDPHPLVARAFEPPDLSVLDGRRLAIRGADFRRIHLPAQMWLFDAGGAASGAGIRHTLRVQRVLRADTLLLERPLERSGDASLAPGSWCMLLPAATLLCDDLQACCVSLRSLALDGVRVRHHRGAALLDNDRPLAVPVDTTLRRCVLERAILADAPVSLRLAQVALVQTSLSLADTARADLRAGCALIGTGARLLLADFAFARLSHTRLLRVDSGALSASGRSRLLLREGIFLADEELLRTEDGASAVRREPSTFSQRAHAFDGEDTAAAAAAAARKGKDAAAASSADQSESDSGSDSDGDDE